MFTSSKCEVGSRILVLQVRLRTRGEGVYRQYLATLLGYALACPTGPAKDIRLPRIDKAASRRSLRTRPHWQQSGYDAFERFPSGAEGIKTV